jgi:hypothetical protein
MKTRQRRFSGNQGHAGAGAAAGGATEARQGRRRETTTEYSTTEVSVEPRRKKPRGGGGVSGEDIADAAPFGIMGGKGEVLARWMEDSGPLWAARDADALRATLRRDGFLLLRGLLPRGGVQAARNAALAALTREVPHLFAAPAPGPEGVADGRLVPGAANLGLLSRQNIANMPEVRAVLECDELFDVAEALLGGGGGGGGRDTDGGGGGGDGGGGGEGVDPAGRGGLESTATASANSAAAARGGGGGGGGCAITTAYKWFRAVAGGEFTGVHTDRVFLGRGTDRLITAWIPFGQVAVKDGALMVGPARFCSPRHPPHFRPSLLE